MGVTWPWTDVGTRSQLGADLMQRRVRRCDEAPGGWGEGAGRRGPHPVEGRCQGELLSPEWGPAGLEQLDFCSLANAKQRSRPEYVSR